MHKALSLAVLLVSLSVPCKAATEWYVAQDPVAKDCSVVSAKPDGKKLVMIGSSAYPTRDEAKKAKHTAPECSESGEPSDATPD